MMLTCVVLLMLLNPVGQSGWKMVKEEESEHRAEHPLIRSKKNINYKAEYQKSKEQTV